MPAARYEPYLRRQLARIPAARRPALRWIEDRKDYLAPRRLTLPASPGGPEQGRS